jgi:hypothetical protein
LAVHAENRLRVGRPFLDMVDAKLSSVSVGDVRVVRRKGIPGEILEASVRGAKNLHGGSLARNDGLISLCALLLSQTVERIEQLGHLGEVAGSLLAVAIPDAPIR